MTFWGGSKLLIEIGRQGIVTPFRENQIDCSAYTLRLGAEAFVTPSFGDDLRTNVKQSLAKPTMEMVGGKERPKGGGTVVIPPGQFAFLLTDEIVKIPNNVMGFISLKSKHKFRGLINVSGFHVDPGFEGRLVYSVFNAGPAALHFSRGDELFLLWLADLSGDVQERYYKTEFGYADITSDLVTDVSRQTHSLQDLASRVDAISESFRTFKAIATGVATALGLAIAVLTLVATALAVMPPKAMEPSGSPSATTTVQERDPTRELQIDAGEANSEPSPLNAPQEAANQSPS
ncbi:MAG: hypothetical protein RIB52_01990 [Erythrobacter sp.]|uniref:dCTP deaminase domain-containing protein n=1 Tax=Erythrobacter sp. TaxID=1042 RepID=UPI0032EED918